MLLGGLSCGQRETNGDAPSRHAELDEAQARQLAESLVNEEFRRSKLFDAEGKPAVMPVVRAGDFRTRFHAGQWHLAYGGPAGPYADVSFDKLGQHPVVQAGFATE